MTNNAAFDQLRAIASLTLPRLQREVEAACTRRGMRGDCLADTGSRLGTLDQELLAIEIYLELPVELVKDAKCLALQMVKAAVLTHFDNDDVDECITPASTKARRPSETIHPAIERARRDAIANGKSRKGRK